MKSETSLMREGLASNASDTRNGSQPTIINGENSLIPFTSALHKRDQIRSIAQFRMGSHWLNTERMRVVDGVHIPRSMRHCQLCGFQKPEDEMHVFECPFYNDIRLRYQKLFTDIYRHVHEDTDLTVWNVEFCDSTFRTFMNGNGTKTFWSNLAD